MVHTATIHRPEVRTTVLLIIAVAVAVPHLLPEAAAIPAEAVAAVLHTVAVVAVVPYHPVAAVEAVAVAEVEDKR